MVRLGQEGVAWGGGNCLKYLKRGWKRKEGKRGAEKKISNWGEAGSRGGCLKKGRGGGGWNPLSNYACSSKYATLTFFPQHGAVLVQVISQTMTADLPVLSSMLSRLFESSQYLDDVSLHHLVDALCRLSAEDMDQASNNKVGLFLK